MSRRLIAYGGLLGLGLGAVVISALAMYHPASPQWGVVDMAAVMRAVSADLAKTYPNGNVPPRDKENAIKQVKDALQEVSQGGQIVLVAQSAVLTGKWTDYTSAVLQALEATP